MRATKNLLTTASLLFTCLLNNSVLGQDSSTLFFTTSTGVFIPIANFSKAYKNSIAINSGIEYKLAKKYSLQFVLDYNSVGYNQQFKDIHSSYLFQKTSSSVFLAGFNLLRNIPLVADGRLFASPYIGVGFANIGEPRLSVDNNENIIKQSVVRMLGIYGKGGLRIAYNTGSKLLQTVYVDASYWTANIHVQQSKAQAVSILAGTRIGF